MASIGNNSKKLTVKKKAYLLGIISFFAFVLFFGIRAVYAYYNITAPLSIIASKIGDFDTGDADVNMIIYKETGEGTNVFVKTYAVPALGYSFNDDLTSCTKPCDDDKNANCHITCGKNSTCNYKYDEQTNIFSLTSDHKLTCKFYFNSFAQSDINVNVMLENDEGNNLYNNKKYLVNKVIPAYGYKYVGYTCDDEEAVQSFEYDSETKKFIISTSTGNTCYAYFDKYGSSDIVVNAYVQSEAGSAVYEPVETIPANKTYTLSTKENSWCYDSDGNDLNTSISYVDGYIDISASSNQTCDVYLDLK